MQVHARPDINALLAEMRAMRQQAQDNALAGQIEMQALVTDSGERVERTERSGFGAVFKDAIDTVNSLQLESGRLASAFVRGEQDDLVATMVAAQKSKVAFEGAIQIRNRLVSAYEDIMNMPI